MLFLLTLSHCLAMSTGNELVGQKLIHQNQWQKIWKNTIQLTESPR